MCSIQDTALGDEDVLGSAALESLTRAIDELAADSRDGTASPLLAERIAQLWAMVSDLDPELARRRAAYERTEDTPGSRHTPRPGEGRTACPARPTSPPGLEESPPQSLAGPDSTLRLAAT